MYSYILMSRVYDKCSILIHTDLTRKMTLISNVLLKCC